jgi:hypothetical protein
MTAGMGVPGDWCVKVDEGMDSSEVIEYGGEYESSLDGFIVLDMKMYGLEDHGDSDHMDMIA